MLLLPISKLEETPQSTEIFDWVWAQVYNQIMAEKQSEFLYFLGMQSLRDCYKLCIDKGSDYVEK